MVRKFLFTQARIRRGRKGFLRWVKYLAFEPIFIFVTIWGHFAILSGAFAFYHFEKYINPKIENFGMAYFWAISTATTVGSDINAHTVGGRIAAVFVMVSGSLFLWSYAALFAASLVTPEVSRLGREMEELESEMGEVLSVDKKTILHLSQKIEQIEKILNQKNK